MNGIHKQKDLMWYIKSVTEAIQIFVFLICAIGFIITFLIMLCTLPEVWGKPISYNPDSVIGDIMGWCVGIGLVNFLFLISRDKDWRRDYRDNDMEDEFD